MTPFDFSLIFVLLLATQFSVRLYLAQRQLRHVMQHRDQVPIAFGERISIENHQRAADYTRAKVSATIFEMLVHSLWLIVLTLGGLLTQIQSWIASVWLVWMPDELPGPGLAFQVSLMMTVMVLGSLIDVGFSLWRQFVIDQRFGFNRMSLALWCSDQIKSLVISVLLGVPFLLFVLWMMEQSGARWWLWVWASWMLFQLGVMVLWPSWIAPLFNRFEPLQEGDVKTAVESLLARCGFSSQGLFVMDGSKRSSHGNAYFTGMGKAKRIVFFDTLLAQLSPREIEAVLAHELGHFKHRHLVKRLLLSAAFSFAALALLAWVMDQSWFYRGLGLIPLPGSQNAAALLLFSLVLSVFLFPLQPLMSWWSRQHEFEADAYAASQTDAADLESALIKLVKDNAATLTPDPLHSAVYDSHPPAPIRIARLQQLRLELGSTVPAAR
ncbi:MAG: M48 family peptidase [Betaproteobacteria bacterium]|nr:M48 family metallopeptidase [Pseudomonadota bacterium]NBP61491.1 M48 family peptidase [Betaproteobacteria bacterium]NBQ09235.1 M48 family peptidase [Betaproteobacteria bacterium]NBU66107.1 M48 family peptidase [Betaproteobacteria bacterium]NCX23205.1 M48 family peptidase [Betaproteobacteria bacterium]